MDIFFIIVASCTASLLTLFSGFGLGTLLTPVFLLFFPVETSIALTGIVHFFNNIFKVGLLGKHTQWKIVFQFGIPSMIGAFVGAQLLVKLMHLDPIAQYTFFTGKIIFIEPVKMIVAVIMMYFAITEMAPASEVTTTSQRLLPAGGILSGFFGGLSGHQGALRSAFLLRYGMKKEEFLATGIIIACLVDITRLSMYSARFLAADLEEHLNVILVAVVSAFLGAYAGNRMLKKVTDRFIQRIVAFFLMIIAAGLGSGLL